MARPMEGIFSSVDGENPRVMFLTFLIRRCTDIFEKWLPLGPGVYIDMPHADGDHSYAQRVTGHLDSSSPE